MQPSVSVIDPNLSENLPAGQFMSRHSIKLPPKEYLPAAQSTQPSVGEVEPVCTDNMRPPVRIDAI